MKTRVLVQEFLASKHSEGWSESTYRWYKSLLVRFAWSVKELPAAPGPIEAFLEKVHSSRENKHAFYRALRCFYGWSNRRHKIKNPMKAIRVRQPRKKVPYSLTAAELAWLLAVPVRPWERALLYLLADTGIRIGEALNLCHGDIHPEFIVVEGKTGQREVPISPETRDQLVALGSRGPVFKTYKGPLTLSGAYKVVKTTLRRAGIDAKKWGPHVLRHTFGRQYIMAGGDLVSLQRLMGHSNIATTRIYAELDLRDITNQHRRFTPLLAAAKSAQGLMFMDHRPQLQPEVRN